jgi:hypothetical protein
VSLAALESQTNYSMQLKLLRLFESRVPACTAASRPFVDWRARARASAPFVLGVLVGVAVAFGSEALTERTEPAVSPIPEPVEDAAEPYAPLRSLKRATPLSEEAAALHLAEAWRVVTGASASRETLSVLWAQWALETARGLAMYDYNFAGIKGRSPRGESSVRWTWERTTAGAERVRQRFRAYETPEEGAHDYVLVLRERFSEAFAAAETGDAAAFARALARAGYHSKAQAEYERAVRLLAREFLGRMDPEES